MVDHPIIFNTEMVRAIAANRKQQTRRKFTDKNYRDISIGIKLGECFALEDVRSYTDDYILSFCPLGVVGDELWVREKWRLYSSGECPCYEYCCCPPSGTPMYYSDCFDDDAKWKPSIFMPKDLARTRLVVELVSYQRLQSINHEDAIKEGIHVELKGEPGFETHFYKDYITGKVNLWDPVESFKTLWISIYGEQDWLNNPYVWVVDFKKI